VFGTMFTNCITNNIAFSEKISKNPPPRAASATAGLEVAAAGSSESINYDNKKLPVILKIFFKFAKKKIFFICVLLQNDFVTSIKCLA
jgi:hypothetical protein